MQRDDAYLLDILIAARKLVKFSKGFKWENFKQNDLLQSAMIHPLEVIGEAASRISQEMKNAHPEIPWKDMIGMRNRLIHQYFRISIETVWDTVQNDIPKLIEAVEQLVPPQEKA